jgi:Zn-finger nucleic acid-binding protein
LLFEKRIDVMHVECPGCGKRVNCSTVRGAAKGMCPQCGGVVDVPMHLRGVRRGEASEVMENEPEWVEPREKRDWVAMFAHAFVTAAIVGFMLLMCILFVTAAADFMHLGNR